MRRFSDPEFLYPINDEEIRDKAKKLELETYSPDLVKDMVAFQTGGAAKKEKELKSGIHIYVPKSDSDGEWRYPISRKYGSSRERFIEESLQIELNYHENIIQFVKGLSYKDAPGNTPLQKSLGIIKMLSDSIGSNISENQNGEITIPIFEETKNAERQKNKINEKIENLKKLTKKEKELLMEFSEYSSKLDEINDLVELSNESMNEILEISRELNELSLFAKRKSKEVEVDANGTDIRTRGIKDLSELPRIRRPAWAQYLGNKNLFIYKAINHNLMINEKVTRRENKQFIYFLVDTSGSMDNDRKIKRVQGIILNRLKAVMDKDCKVWLSFFEEGLSELHKAEDKESAKELYKELKNHYYNGGGTNIPAAVIGAVDTLEKYKEENPGSPTPEITVITDDDESSESLKLKDLKGNKLHAFSLDKNPALIRLARQSGGVGIENYR